MQSHQDLTWELFSIVDISAAHYDESLAAPTNRMMGWSECYCDAMQCPTPFLDAIEAAGHAAVMRLTSFRRF